MSQRLMFTCLVMLALVAMACNPTAADSTSGPAASVVARSAQLSELRNTVEARNTASAEWQAAVEGQPISVGGGAKTGEDARARVDISDGAIVRLGADTQFELTELSPKATGLTLDAGKLWTSVATPLSGTFEIETPVGVAAVRGSLMGAEYFPADRRFIVTCLEGLCRLTGTSGKFTDLRTGQQSEIPGPGQDPTPAQDMDASQLEDWAQEFPEAQSVVVTITPRPVVTETPTPTPTPPGGSGQTACDHPYFPLRPDATWSYTTSDGISYSWTITSVQGDTTSATAEMTANYDGTQVTYTWQCDPTGIVSFQFGTITADTSGQFAAFNVTGHSGTFMPPAELLAPGYSWTNTFEVELQFTEAAGGASGTLTRSETYTVIGVEPVTVNGQTVDGIRISGTGTSDIVIQLTGVSVPPVHTEDSSTWVLGKGIGIVRTQGRFEDIESSAELTEYTIP